MLSITQKDMADNLEKIFEDVKTQQQPVTIVGEDGRNTVLVPEEVWINLVQSRQSQISSNQNVTNYLKKYRSELEQIVEDIPIHVILYGAYARGEADRNSDIEVLLLIDTTPEELYKYSVRVTDYTYDFNRALGTRIMPLIMCLSIFREKKAVVSRYQEMEKDGIEIY